MKNSIAYAGRVQIKVKGTPPVRKNNNGTNVFFNLMRNIMTFTDTERSKSLPYYMSIVSLPSGTPEEFNTFPEYNRYDPLLLYPILITSRTVPYKTEEGVSTLENGKCVLSALLPKSATITGANLSNNAYVVLLNNMDVKQILAYTEADAGALKPVFEETNGQAVIEWELTFGNQEGDKN